MDTISLLQQLVQIESYSGQEENLANFIVAWTKDHDLPVERQNGNVIIKLLNDSPTALIFNAHMDTIKPGNLDFWSTPPTGSGSGKIKGNNLYGLGASDDKSAIASLLALASQLKGLTLPADVFIIFVTNEEISGAGSQSFVSYFQNNYADKYKEISAVIGEPTDLQAIEIGHRGNVFLKIITNGDSGHGSKPEEIKKHSVYENIKVVQKITGLGKELAKKYKDPVLGVPSFCLTGIQSDSSSVNRVSSSCYSTWDIRTTPKLHYKLIHLLQKEVGKAVTVEYINPPAPFGLTSSKSKIVSLFQDLLPNLRTKISPGSNDICFFTQAGIPAVTFGPGKKDVIHKPDEYVEIANVEKSIAIYKQLLENYSL